MTDPISGASAAMQGLQKLQESANVGQDVAKSGSAKSSDGPSFKEVMQQKTDQAQATDQVKGTPPVEQPTKLPPTQNVQASQRLDKFVKGVFKDEAKINRMMRRCSRGKTLEQGELLQLQGLIYSYGQKIDLASKLVDKATGGVKQIMNTQV